MTARGVSFPGRMRALVTGSEGSLGRALCRRLEYTGWEVARFDIARTLLEDVRRPIRFQLPPDVVFHLAAAKHAPEGELDPWETTRTNVQGTRNVLELGARTILASTCKAADPETVYGATKLIAERMVLAAGGSVARLYNVPESGGNVFEKWARLPAGAPLEVTPCVRYLMSMDAAIRLLVTIVDELPGRYAIDPGPPHRIADLAARLYPARPVRRVPPRRGDRLVEPRHARCERTTRLPNGLRRIVSPHDPPAASFGVHQNSEAVAACG